LTSSSRFLRLPFNKSSDKISSLQLHMKYVYHRDLFLVFSGSGHQRSEHTLASLHSSNSKPPKIRLLLFVGPLSFCLLSLSTPCIVFFLLPKTSFAPFIPANLIHQEASL
jgi:hypothetical protein